MADPNPWRQYSLLKFAHQGRYRDLPPSTLHAMEWAAVQMRAALQLDVYCSADGELVVFHDATVDSTTNGSGAIASLTLSELQRLDNAAHFPPYAGRAPFDRRYRVPTLREVLEAFPDTLLNLDVRQAPPDVPPYEERLATLLRTYGRAADSVIVGSHDDDALDRFSSVAPEYCTSAGARATAAFRQAVREGAEPPAMRHAALQVPVMSGDEAVVDGRLLDAAHAAGMVVYVGTVNDEDEMRRLVRLRVDGIVTDDPGLLDYVTSARPEEH